MFKDFDKLENEPITSQREFDDSDFSGIDKMMGVKSFRDLMVGISDDTIHGEQVSEKYFFLQAYAENELVEDDMEIFILDNYKFCLVDLYDGKHAIVIKKNNFKSISELLND